MQNENGKDILPALGETPSTQMSSKEFQRSLYTWFEEKGLVADLRSYLRMLMINELRSTTVGKTEPRTNFSLSKQAFSLIIAEHLLREGCHYTLSIFSTEVPGIAHQLPFSLFEAHHRDDSWRFDQESLLHVLELIGIPKGSSESLRIVALYFRNNDSLLNCLINAKSSGIDLSEIEDTDNYLDNVLKALSVPPNIISHIKIKIENYYRRQLPIERKQIEDVQKILYERNNQLKILLDDQLALKKENKKLRNELKETAQRLKQALLREQNFSLKENEIRDKLDEVAKLQKNLEKSLEKDKSEICPLKHCTESCQNLLTNNDQLKAEILKLEQSNKEKSLEIEHLNSKVALLTKDLHNSKANIEFLNTCFLRTSQMDLHQGEENPSSSDSSDNVTGEILKQVRSRLQQLEIESDELDSKFKKLKMNQFSIK